MKSTGVRTTTATAGAHWRDLREELVLLSLQPQMRACWRVVAGVRAGASAMAIEVRRRAFKGGLTVKGSGARAHQKPTPIQLPETGAGAKIVNSGGAACAGVRSAWGQAWSDGCEEMSGRS
jgi:hypothetical protein